MTRYRRRPVATQCGAFASVVVGIVLLAVTIIGDTGIYSGIAPESPSQGESWSPRMFHSVRSLDALYEAATGESDNFTELPPAAKMDLLFHAEISRFVISGHPLTHTIFTNWIMRALGLIDP